MSSPALGQEVGSCELGLAEATLDVNGVSATVYNTGRLFGREPDEPRYNVPAGSPHHAIRNAHVWIAGLVDGELRVSASTDDRLEMWPGPVVDAESPPPNCADYDRIFKVTKEDLEALDDSGMPTDDIRDWPWRLGAPVEDGDGISNNYDLEYGDRPAIEGDQTLWWIMNDVGNEHRWSRTPPLGVEVRATAYAVKSGTEALKYTTFYRFDITNRSLKTIEDTYFGMHVDPQIGRWNDDFVGSDTTYGVAYAYNGDGVDDDFGDESPVIGITVLEGPILQRRRRMTNFMTFRLDDSYVGEPGDGATAYNYLRSIWPDDSPLSCCSGPWIYGRWIPSRMRFMFPGRPPYFWSEVDSDGAGSPDPPSDRRFVWSTGPFRLDPGGSTTVLIAIIWAQGADRFKSIYKLLDLVPEVRLQHLYLQVPTENDRLDFPTTLELKPPYPNPSNGPRSLVYGVPGQQRVSLAVYDLLGRRVDAISDRQRTVGWHTETWDPKSLSAGTYFLVLESGPHRSVQPVIIAR